MSPDSFLVRGVVACYPTEWRERYGDEYASVVSDSLAAASALRRLALLVNVVRGALDARMNPEGPFVSKRVGVPIAAVVWAAGLFGLAGFGFQKITEYPDFKEAAEQHAAVGWSYTIVVWAAGAAAVSVVLAGLPVALALLRERPPGFVKVLAVPSVAVLAWFGSLPLAYLLAEGHSVHSPGNLVAIAVVVAVSVGVVAAVAWAAAAVERRAQVRAVPRMRAVVLIVVAAAMAATTVACAAWGIALRAGDPAEFNSNDGLVAASLPASWAGITLVMAVATILAIIACRREMVAAAPEAAA
jgi:hypothetical protein